MSLLAELQYLTGCSDWLTDFREPLSPPHRSMSHWFEKYLARSLISDFRGGVTQAAIH